MRWQSLRPVVILVAFSTGSVAAVAAPVHCRLHRIWNYPWPQTCRSIRYAAMAPIPIRAPARQFPEPPILELSLPGLSDIQWGEFADEYTRGKILLRAAMEKPSDN
jgi:hypothetical protein